MANIVFLICMFDTTIAIPSSYYSTVCVSEYVNCSESVVFLMITNHLKPSTQQTLAEMVFISHHCVCLPLHLYSTKIDADVSATTLLLYSLYVLSNYFLLYSGKVTDTVHSSERIIKIGRKWYIHVILTCVFLLMFCWHVCFLIVVCSLISVDPRLYWGREYQHYVKKLIGKLKKQSSFIITLNCILNCKSWFCRKETPSPYGFASEFSPGQVWNYENNTSIL